MKESREQRSKTMKAVRSQDTSPEIAVRRFLHSHGLRYRLHVKDLPGKPDIVFPSRMAVVFVHGCFWHQHSGCPAAVRPVSNTEYWNLKLDRNIARDIEIKRKLKGKGWRVYTIWECQIKDENNLVELEYQIRHSSCT